MSQGASSLQVPAPVPAPVRAQVPTQVATEATATRTWRQRTEPMVRRLLFVPQPTVGASSRRRDEAGAQRLFNVSMALSGLRCLLSYVVLPIVTPALGAAARVGPMVGVPIAVVALFFDVVAVRRFWAADHRWRWGVSGVYLVVMSLVLALLIGDVVHLAS